MHSDKSAYGAEPSVISSATRRIEAIRAAQCIYQQRRINNLDCCYTPGAAAIELCPDILEELAKGVPTILVTGTNGKTTTVRMIAAVLRAAGMAVFTNKEGANMESGIVTISECLQHYYLDHDGSLTNRYVPGLLSTLLWLHREKLSWMACSVTDRRALRRFRYNDWNFELHNWLQSICGYAPKLSEEQLREAYAEMYEFRIKPAFFFYSMGEKYADVPKMLLVRSMRSFRAFRRFLSETQ